MQSQKAAQVQLSVRPVLSVRVARVIVIVVIVQIRISPVLAILPQKGSEVTPDVTTYGNVTANRLITNPTRMLLFRLKYEGHLVGNPLFGAA